MPRTPRKSVSPKSLLLASSFAGVVALPCFFQVGEAHAQAVAAPPGSLTPYPACTSKPTAQDSEAAHSAYNLGKRFFEESDYTSASHNFIDAFKLDCSKPELLLNIARANELLGNRAEAVHALETYLQRSTTLSLDEKTQLQRRIDNLKAALAAQAVPIPVATATATAPVVVAPLPPPMGAPPPPPPSSDERKHTPWPWLVAGVGGATAITGVALYFVGGSKISSAEKGCTETGGVYTCSGAAGQAAASSGSTGDTLKGAGEGMFWAGLAVAGGGLIWHFLEPTGPAKADAPRASFSPILAPGYTGASVVGNF